ncbi:MULTISPECIES: hypothetical protein [unclassified Pseudomonas]|uniref:hypothetical protein n=1 Tax=unclassified Pseudomonas TaxID=196821 RepID=UPI000A1E98F2|nr:MULTISPECIES: hypothetical protein [unclassified Pseudomonas]
MIKANKGVAFLIEQAKKTNSDDLQQRLLEALGEAGGDAAMEYLVSEAKKTNPDWKRNVLIKAIGRASRHNG